MVALATLATVGKVISAASAAIGAAGTLVAGAQANASAKFQAKQL